MSKKELLVTGILVIISLTLYSQDHLYSVLKVSGIIHCERLDKDLAAGDKVHGNDKLSFKSKEDYMIVINIQDGRKMVRPSGTSHSSELKSLLNEIVALQRKHSASRGHDTLAWQLAVKKMKAEMNVNKLLVLGRGKISFEGQRFLLNDTAAVKVRYRSENSSTEKLISSGSVLDLSKNAIFDSHPPVKVQLVYYPNVNKDLFQSPAETIGHFVPVYLNDEKEVVNETRVIVSLYQDQKKEIIVEVVKKHIEHEYGFVLDQNLLQWLSETNLLKP